jgi:hypothetical protein
VGFRGKKAEVDFGATKCLRCSPMGPTLKLIG